MPLYSSFSFFFTISLSLFYTHYPSPTVTFFHSIIPTLVPTHYSVLTILHINHKSFFGGCPRCVIAKALNAGYIVSGFELPSRYYVHFWITTGLVGRVFANGPGDQGSIPGRVIPKTQKMVLDAALHKTQHYKVRIKSKVEQSREGVAPPLHLGVVAIEKGAFGSPSTLVANFTYPS